MSCKAMRNKLLRRPAEPTTTPLFPCQGSILVLVFFSLLVGLPPQMTLFFISETLRAPLEQQHPTLVLLQAIP